MKWFGKAHGALYESDCEHTATPVGHACGRCDEAIVEGDDGFTMPYHGGGEASLLGEPNQVLAFHYACHLRGIIGGVNHLLARCTCCGGDQPPDPPELTRRQAAEAAVLMHYGRKRP